MMAQNDEPVRTVGPVEKRINTARDALPGQRDGLPAGTLGGLPPDPQGDENRDPPPAAPIYPK